MLFIQMMYDYFPKSKISKQTNKQKTHSTDPDKTPHTSNQFHHCFITDILLKCVKKKKEIPLIAVADPGFLECRYGVRFADCISFF